jgi:hypothetical protein
MIKTTRTWLVALVFAGIVGGSFTTLFTPQTTYAAGCIDKVLTFPTWYANGLAETKGSGKDTTCEIKSPGSGKDALSNFIWKIGLNILEIALQLVGYIAVGFLIYGGFKYITGAGAPDKITAGRKIILNAVIGLVISLFSVAIVNLVNRGFP